MQDFDDIISYQQPWSHPGTSFGSVQPQSGGNPESTHHRVGYQMKPSYQRPKHDRVHCTLCENDLEGFRGEHELWRHKDGEHNNGFIKKFVCMDQEDGRDHPKPVIPLSKCKACSGQKKTYGAYYNAAAHLRRVHFNPKAKQSAKLKTSPQPDSRGGRTDGEWPPMAELKLWMKEIEVHEEYNSPNQDGSEEVIDGEQSHTLDDHRINNDRESAQNYEFNPLKYQSFQNTSGTLPSPEIANDGNTEHTHCPRSIGML